MRGHERPRRGREDRLRSLGLVVSRSAQGLFLDSTTLNRQGSDVGTQYRSVIYCQTPAQRADANAVIDELSREKLWSQPIVTEIADAAPFYPAEKYHQEYFDRLKRQ